MFREAFDDNTGGFTAAYEAWNTDRKRFAAVWRSRCLQETVLAAGACPRPRRYHCHSDHHCPRRAHLVASLQCYRGLVNEFNKGILRYRTASQPKPKVEEGQSELPEQKDPTISTALLHHLMNIVRACRVVLARAATPWQPSHALAPALVGNANASWQIYTRSVTDPSRLNQYKGWSEEVSFQQARARARAAGSRPLPNARGGAHVPRRPYRFTANFQTE